MEKISNYISKKVITLDEGEYAGFVLNVIFDEDLNKLIGFIVVDEESDNVFTFKKEEVRAVGEDCIIISSAKKLQIFLEEDGNSPVGKQVYDTSGFLLGRVVDVVIDGLQVRRIITTKCEFFRRNIRKLGKNYIIFGNKERKKNKKETKLFKIEDENMPKVYIQKVGTMPSQSQPYRLLANQNSILGRTMINDLYGYNNEIIAKKYDIINQNIINRAKMHNKLNFLIYYSK